MGIRAGLLWPAFIAVASVCAPASAAPLKPVGAWQLDYAENECRLIREFGADSSKTWLRIARGARMDKFDLMIGGVSLPPSNRQIDMKIAALPDGQAVDVTATPYTAKVGGETNNVYHVYTVDNAFLDGLTNTQILGFTTERGANVELEATGIKKALTALSKCHDDLLTTVYKLDLPRLRSYQSLPQPGKGVAAWVTTDDYPRDALAKKWEGRVSFVISVDEQGKPTGCDVVISSGYADLDQLACRLMTKRGSFTPAKDANGQPVAAPWVSAVHWQVPRS